ncbi:hypothetical protein B0H17DRAFT_1130625 [Mycena rosella]|uniref:Uncharacterized protein n=1 Tax=Mycena rosella TaxID=1033263 RepID=A0AAD7DPZ8_MYCRO|nr:hypothetical protein B0H17DRAFT_1130625 [Mycena rosella]
MPPELKLETCAQISFKMPLADSRPREAPPKGCPEKWLFEARNLRFPCPKCGFFTPKCGQGCPGSGFLSRVCWTESNFLKKNKSQILHIPAPKPILLKPLDLTPLGVPPPKAQPSNDSDDDDAEFDEEDDPSEQRESEPLCRLDASEESRMVSLAAHDAARYSALCDDYENAVKELDALPPSAVVFGPPLPPPVAVVARPQPLPVRSELIDAAGNLSISMMLRARLHWQADTTTRSEKVSEIDSKYALSRIARAAESQGNGMEPEKMTIQEASNRVLQEQNATIQQSQPRKYREVRWKGIAAAVQKLVDTDERPPTEPSRGRKLDNYVERYPILNRGNLGHPEARRKQPLRLYPEFFFCLGPFLSISACGEDSDSDDDQGTGDSAAPLFSGHYKGRRIRLSTHAKIHHLLFNLGPNIFERVEAGVQHRTLKLHAALCWTSLTKPGAVSKEVKKVTLKAKFPEFSGQPFGGASRGLLIDQSFPLVPT